MMCSTFLDNIILAETSSSAGSQKNCKVDFENMDYSIFTNTCKRPLLPAKPCCDALKVFACPYVDDINDATTTCAHNMIYSIYRHGKYPMGLFSKKCKEGVKGLACRPRPAAARPFRRRGAGRLFRRRGAGRLFKRRGAAKRR
ncbi:hypothetical protein Tsubulata_047066, partial [Turnera subulata]